MKDLGVFKEELWTMTAAGVEEIASVDEDWKGLFDTMRGKITRQ